MSSGPSDNLLIVGNFPSDTGYAWKTIGEYFLALAGLFKELGGETVICYPKLNGKPERFTEAGIRIESFDFFNSSLYSIYKFIRKYRITVLYLTDRGVLSLRNVAARLAGVKKIVYTDRTSGHRDIPRGVRKLWKQIVHRYPIASVDLAVGVSNYIHRRIKNVICVPEERTARIYNGLDIEKFKPGEDGYVYECYGIPREKKIVFAHSRANKYKGIQTLIEAADIIVNRQKRDDVIFLYCGDGPDIGCFRDMVAQRNLNDRFHCPGPSNEVVRIMKGVTVAVVPSIWQEGLGLSVFEAMATGKPIAATRVGGIVEIIENGKDGFLFEPEDSESLVDILTKLLDDEELCARTGTAARKTMVTKWNIEDRKKEWVNVFRKRVLEIE
jgi:glycosyltransferase involved in cell wall biosynthesis